MLSCYSHIAAGIKHQYLGWHLSLALSRTCVNDLKYLHLLWLISHASKNKVWLYLACDITLLLSTLHFWWLMFTVVFQRRQFDCWLEQYGRYCWGKSLPFLYRNINWKCGIKFYQQTNYDCGIQYYLINRNWTDFLPLFM